MYNAQATKERIKSLCKKRKVNMEDVLVSCELGVNAIRQINDNKGMASYSLAKIADYLDCSVDYLLGRIDTPNGTYSISGDNNVQVNGSFSTANVESQSKDAMVEEFLEVFKKLNFSDKVEVMNFAMEKAKGE